ncbi:heme ABC transporter ATP-binding protein [Bacillus lacus]|uniref:Heme ABC transporter ATP-binding protein n=1 Tax=Metabacillus lacus TaxID=1983721 RepID=A0A7X2J0I4_9BACI|nr:heme ABC transporter ATP-binding protein [Metabacillus lacus]MRX72508.1 heme ABC transporter ATP-binding protein [Metabacillus lacus]
MLDVQDVTGSYSGKPAAAGISFHVKKGELFGILGPNGSGKTTLLKMISGIHPADEGSISVKGKPLNDYSSRERARCMAVLPQHSSLSFSYTVRETVSLGRYPHQSGLLHSWSEKDENIVREVMGQTGIQHLEHRQMVEISGGEQQRVYLAQALAQEPEILLLDEPTNHLDLAFQKDLLDLLKLLTKERDLTVLSIFHDLNLAALYCDRLLLLNKGSISKSGAPSEVLAEKSIRDVYQTSIGKQQHPQLPVPQMVLLPNTRKVRTVLDASFLEISHGCVVYRSPVYLKTMSSGVTGAGAGWNRYFVNRHVDKNYDCSGHRTEMADYLERRGFPAAETVGMMTAVFPEDAVYCEYKEKDFSVIIAVTAGTGNAVDASMSSLHAPLMMPGTINTWVIINGELTDEAFIQCIMTATEAKARALQDEGIKDAITGTAASGTSTDSILIAATQTGPLLEYGGTITPLGKSVGKGVYQCTRKAIEKSQRRQQTC